MLIRLSRHSFINSRKTLFLLIAILYFPFTQASETEVMKAIEDAKDALTKKDYQRMWRDLDAITQWLEETSPRSGLSWEQAQAMIKKWVKKNWRKDAKDIKALSEGGMESTTERHQGSFRGLTWDTGEKTMVTDFVFEAEFKALDSKNMIRTHKVRFHFDKGSSGWYIKSGGVM